MTNDNDFLSSLAVGQETINKINRLPGLLAQREVYLRDFKECYFAHLRREFNLLHTVFPSADIVPEARIKSQKSYYDKAVKVSNYSDATKNIYDIFANRYVIKSINGSSEETDLIPVLYLIRDFLSYAFPDIRNVATRQKDYISHPKDSTYQALHITRLHVGDGNYFSETQLQSGFMNYIAQSGSASHSATYKERVPGQASVPIILDYVIDNHGFCVEVKEKSFEQCFEEFFNIPFDESLYPTVINEK